VAARDGVPGRLREAAAPLDDDALVASLTGAVVLLYGQGAGALAHPQSLRRLATWFGLAPAWLTHQLPRRTQSRISPARNGGTVTATPRGRLALEGARGRSVAYRVDGRHSRVPFWHLPGQRPWVSVRAMDAGTGSGRARCLFR
jgi:hypothetical protein